MRYWAAGLLLTVLLFGGGLLGTAGSPSASRPVPGADPGQTGENAGQPAADADTVLRVFMAWKPLDAPVEIEAQPLTAPTREGFTLVEWGGSRVD